MRPQTAGALATSPRPYFPTKSASPKVLSMSNHARRQHTPGNLPDQSSILARIEAELANGYLEVPAEGITFKQFLCVYLAFAREGRERMVGGLRSLFRFHPAH